MIAMEVNLEIGVFERCIRTTASSILSDVEWELKRQLRYPLVVDAAPRVPDSIFAINRYGPMTGIVVMIIYRIENLGRLISVMLDY